MIKNNFKYRFDHKQDYNSHLIICICPGPCLKNCRAKPFRPCSGKIPVLHHIIQNHRISSLNRYLHCLIISAGIWSTPGHLLFLSLSIAASTLVTVKLSFMILDSMLWLLILLLASYLFEMQAPLPRTQRCIGAMPAHLRVGWRDRRILSRLVQ